MPRPLSDSWQYFELLAPDNGRSRKARCTFCGHEQAAGITRLHQHLLYRCSRITSDIREDLRQKNDDRGRDSPPKNDLLAHQLSDSTVNYHFDSSTLQNTLHGSHGNHTNSHHHSPNPMNPTNTYYETAATLSPTTTSTHFSTNNPSLSFSSSNTTLHQPPPQPQQPPQQQRHDRSQAMLDCQLARAFFSANIPFETIENPHLIDFLKRLQPNYIVPKSRRLKQYILKEQHWDLIDWENDQDLLLTSRTQSPTTSLQQQQRRNMMHNTNNTNNNNTNNESNLNNRLLSSLHPPADLEGSL